MPTDTLFVHCGIQSCMSETGSIYIGKYRVFGTDRSGKATVFKDGEEVGKISQPELEEMLGVSDDE